MNLVQRIFNFPKANPVQSIRQWFNNPQPPLGQQPDFGVLRDNLLHWPNFNGSHAPVVPQTAASAPVFLKSNYLAGLTSIILPRPGP